MNLRPYSVYLFFVPILALPAWQLYQRPRAEYRVTTDKLGRWADLGRRTPEELERGVAHRYQAMATELKDARDVGYFSEKDRSDLWASSSTPAGHLRIERYYMAQSILAPSLLRFDELHALVVIDCATSEQATEVLNRENLAVVRDYGNGLILARPQS